MSDPTQERPGRKGDAGQWVATRGKYAGEGRPRQARRVTVAEHAAWIEAGRPLPDDDWPLDIDPRVERRAPRRSRREAERVLSILDDLDTEGRAGG